jgi:Uncharacterized protein involved in propionate catabolism
MRTTERPTLPKALQQLGEFVARLSWRQQGPTVRAAVQRILFDSLAVTIAGARLPESARLRQALPGSGGAVTVLGQRDGADPVRAAWLNGVAMVCLELDEGNKRARGHAAAHVIPAALALAEDRHRSGESLAAAILAGHEVASRFGEAVELLPGVHPHGNWGVAGAAAAAARITGLSAERTASAIDAAGALALVTPFRTALAGMSVRNAWIGHAADAGIHAAALAAATSEPILGIAADSLGERMGSLTIDTLTAGLGARFAVTSGYFKRHASCSYTHPPADAALALRAQHGPIATNHIERISVQTHRLAAGLTSTSWPTRLAAMFSIPYVVAVALIAGECNPEQFGDAWRTRADVAALAGKVRVSEDAQLTARLPAERVARLRVRLVSGAELAAEVPNPVGDADHHPFTDADVLSKAATLLGNDEQAVALRDRCGELLSADDVAAVMTRVRTLADS